MKICLYYRAKASGVWDLIASGSLDFLTSKMTEFAAKRQCGRLALITSDFQPLSTHDLRSTRIRASHRNALCKALLPDMWRPVRIANRRAWKKVDKRQLELVLG